MFDHDNTVDASFSKLIENLTQAVLVIAQWHGVVLGEFALGCEFLVHVLADDTISSIGTDDDVARVGATNAQSVMDGVYMSKINTQCKTRFNCKAMV